MMFYGRRNDFLLMHLISKTLKVWFYPFGMCFDPVVCGVEYYEDTDVMLIFPGKLL